MKTLTCLIIEDEPLTLEELKYLLKSYDYIEMIGEAKNGIEGLQQIKSLKPDLIFLDINMPGLSGIELAEQLKYLSKRPLVIFTTAHQSYAINAFELGALDYLLKPYDDKRLHLTMERVLKSMPLSIGTEVSSQEFYKAELGRLAVTVSDKVLLIDVNQITYCIAENDKVIVHTRQDEYETNNTLLEVTEKTKLFKIHRSCIVNLKAVKELYPWFNGTYQIKLDDKEQNILTVSRSHVKPLKQALGL